MAARTRGSVRFDPYYKAQWWEERSLAWRDVQRSCSSKAAAEALFDPAVSPRWRVMEITEQGRRPLPEA